jgi:hypothetical protein
LLGVPQPLMMGQAVGSEPPSLAGIVDKGAFTGRVGYAPPTAAPDDRLDPSQGLPALAIRKGWPAPESRPGGPGRGAEACSPPVMIYPRSRRPRRPWRPLQRCGWERGRPAASTPPRASRPCAPFGLRLRRRG